MQLFHRVGHHLSETTDEAIAAESLLLPLRFQLSKKADVTQTNSSLFSVEIHNFLYLKCSNYIKSKLS